MSQLSKFIPGKSALQAQITATTIADWLKPPRSEAITRLRINSLGLLTVVILVHLLPLPAPWVAISVVRERTISNTPYYTLCAAEALVLALLGINILQSLYALRYPRAFKPPPPHPSPVKTLQASSPSRQWRLQGLSPNSSPRPQKSFSYASSPVSTPSRTINYTIPSTTSTPFDSSFTSFTGSVPASPASPLAAYRGRHSNAAGRAFDGSLLSRLALDESDDEVEDD